MGETGWAMKQVKRQLFETEISWTWVNVMTEKQAEARGKRTWFSIG